MKILKASAGSGKTYSLSKTYIDLLLNAGNKDAYRHILAVTFTNKATAEMKSRILSDLYKLSRSDARAREMLVRMLHDYGSFAVSTIDRFFQQVLKSFSREIGQFADYRIELDKESLVKEAMDRILDGITDEDDEAVDLKEQEAEDGVTADKAADETVLSAEKQKLKKSKTISFLLILASIFMWFMGYNAVSSNLSIYIVNVLGCTPFIGTVVSAASMAVSAVAFIPVGMLAVKIGRKKSIMLGLLFATVSFVCVFLFIKPQWGISVKAIMFALFYLIAGFGLIVVNVNTFPMVVELSSAKDVGKYTGYYYMATMSAQAITPYIGGLFMDHLSNRSLFAYSAVCVIISIVLMALVKHGDSKPLPKKKVYEMMEDVD